MIYIIILIYLVFLNIISPKLDKNGILAYWSVCLALVLIAGFRYNLGLDTYAYTNDYKTYPILSKISFNYIKDSIYQPLWILFESTIRTVSKSFYILQLTLSIFVNIIVFKIVKRYSFNPFFTILLYYILFYLNLNMEILRESVALCLLLLGVKFINEKKYYKYYLLATIAFLFHESGIILFIFPLLMQIKLNKKAYIIIIVSAIIISGFLSLFFVEILSKINILIGLSKIKYFDSFEPNSNIQAFNYIKYVFMPSIILFTFFEKLTEYERKYILIYILFSILFIQIYIFYRIRDYFLILFLIAFTNGLTKWLDNKYYHLILKGAIITCFLYISLFRYYYYERNDRYVYQLYLNYYPYNSILDEEIPQSRLINYQNAN
jgi:hypothetical protein